MADTQLTNISPGINVLEHDGELYYFEEDEPGFFEDVKGINHVSSVDAFMAGGQIAPNSEASVEGTFEMLRDYESFNGKPTPAVVKNILNTVKTNPDLKYIEWDNSLNASRFLTIKYINNENKLRTNILQFRAVESSQFNLNEFNPKPLIFKVQIVFKDQFMDRNLLGLGRRQILVLFHDDLMSGSAIIRTLTPTESFKSRISLTEMVGRPEGTLLSGPYRIHGM
jgi:hypothetical protein